MKSYLLVLSVFLSLVAGPAQTATKPNIIFFLVDDYDKPETSVYGGKVLTPNLERLAREGMTFHNVHMTSTVCTPSRYTCLTGRYAGSSYSPKYYAECPEGTQGLPAFNVGLEDDNMNVGNILAKNGYATGLVGEFIPGGNAMPAGSCDDVLEAMRNYMDQFDGDMKKQSKVRTQKKKPAEPSVNASKKAERHARKAQRDKK